MAMVSVIEMAMAMFIFAASTTGAVSLVLTEVDPATGATVHTTLNVSDVPGLIGSLTCSRSSVTVATGPAGIPVDTTHTDCQVAIVEVYQHDSS